MGGPTPLRGRRSVSMCAPCAVLWPQGAGRRLLDGLACGACAGGLAAVRAGTCAAVAGAREAAVGDDEMEMGMPVGQRAVGLWRSGSPAVGPTRRAPTRTDSHQREAHNSMASFRMYALDRSMRSVRRRGRRAALSAPSRASRHVPRLSAPRTAPATPGSADGRGSGPRAGRAAGC